MIEAPIRSEELPPTIEPKTAHEKLVIFAWSGDLDRVCPTLIRATTAAARSSSDRTMIRDRATRRKERTSR